MLQYQGFSMRLMQERHLVVSQRRPNCGAGKVNDVKAGVRGEEICYTHAVRTSARSIHQAVVDVYIFHSIA